MFSIRSGHHGLFPYLLCGLSLSILTACGGGSGGPKNSPSPVPGSSASISSSSIAVSSSSLSSSESSSLNSVAASSISSVSFSSSSTSSVSSSESSTAVLMIQENTPAVLSFFPSTAYVGTINGFGVLQGLSNTSVAPTTSAYIDYSVNVASDGNYKLRVHYAFGGTETNLRDAWIYVNGIKTLIDNDEILEFAYTGATDGKSNTYAYTDYVTVSLVAGDNDIRLVAVNTPNYTRPIVFTRTGSGGTIGTSGTGVAKGLANIEALEVSGAAPITGGGGTKVFYALSTSVKAGMGNITVSPQQDFYLPNTPITLNAIASDNYKFDSWTGDAPSTNGVYNININSNLHLAARFIPSAATQPAGLVGFGSVQSDAAIPYTLTGGFGANTTTVTTLAELKTALAGTGPLSIKISGLIDNSGKPSESLNVPSNTTLYGDTNNQGHLKNIELKLSGENYILRNLIFSEVVAVAIKDSAGNLLVAEGAGNDSLSINGARHVWIDHCELYSSLTPGQVYDFSGPTEAADGVIDEYDAKDFYDGLIDIKNGASFITLSHNYFHDHWKAILIASSDTQDNGDSNTRVTLHHNYFKDIISRIPLLRYGKGHFYNNYVQGTLPTIYGKVTRVDSVFNLRQGAQGLIEGNYIQGTEDSFGYFYTSSTTTTGFWNLLDNIYNDVTNATTTSTGTYMVPYTYTAEAGSGINASVPTTAGVGILTAADLP
ncbi:MAG: hypothetical protein ABW044_01815 [Cellvibrio sp.]